MLILGVETSCDETAVALLNVAQRQPPQILAEEISSQADLHRLYGGVVPELASREHLHNLPLLLGAVLSKGAVELEAISGIGVTRGPGLKGCLLIGLDFVKGLSLSQHIPWVGVNHIEGHLHAARLDNPEVTFPYLALVVSGGHTEIVRVNAVGDYEVLARTIDDAAGEAFDKSANLLGIDYPGGATLATLADSVTQTRFSLPKVMREIKDFSFSGLKTAIAQLISRQSETLIKDETARAELAHAVQCSIIEALIYKLEVAIAESGIKQVVVTGGVAANLALRAGVSALSGIRAYFPTALHCTDNAAMIGYVAALRLAAGERDNYQCAVKPRWSVEELQAV